VFILQMKHEIEIAEYGSVRVQATVSGYTAWVFRRLARRQRLSIGEVAAYGLQRWVDDNAEFLARFGISLDAFESELDDRVVPMPPKGR
jgi:hypothetical protein